MSDETITPGTSATEKKKRPVKRYWREINGKLYARFQYKDDAGKRCEKLRTITDKRTAQSVVADMRKELKNYGAESLQSDKKTFLDLANCYEAEKLIPATYSNGIKVAGRRSYQSPKSALKPLKEYFGKKQIRLIKASDITAYKMLRQNAPVMRGATETRRTVAAVNRELEQLRAMFNFAIENDWLLKNPFLKKKGIISRAAEVERDRVLTFDEEKRLLAACAGRRAHLKPILICALDTAMRRGEMFKMCWHDVDFERGEIKIPTINAKTEVERTVGITPRLSEVLKDLREQSPKDAGGLVFGITDTIKKSFKTACRVAAVENFKLHDARHTATVRMIAAGVTHIEAMKLTGHSQIKTFLRYFNSTPEMVKSCTIKLSNYLIENE